ncbi:hypothetical protein [Bradyrhizobium neotropicale]|uniref:DeoR C-terminal sensor domain-containing protein n=1 Tax=Bradyrhizobium neotropicale TaxID=1497615 RepID=A0A176Z7X7_9BRAD|nr:hypothetical protein [Bradyrhizobium neotropicale]OAF16839.1 hypothetical protein AXW67_11435 [Bradyrhizobium neotropicale]
MLVADTTKFGRNAMVRGGDLDDCQHLFTDGPLPSAFAAIVAKYGGRIHPTDDARAGFERPATAWR